MKELRDRDQQTNTLSRTNRTLFQGGGDVWEYSRFMRFGRVVYRAFPEEVCMVLRSSHLVGKGNVSISGTKLLMGLHKHPREVLRKSGFPENGLKNVKNCPCEHLCGKGWARPVAPATLKPRVERYTKSMSLKYEPTSEPLHISVK